MEKDANSILNEIDIGLKSPKESERLASIFQANMIFQHYPFPTYINSVAIKLSEVFHSASNFIKLIIVELFDDFREQVVHIINGDEFVHRVSAVLHSNDPVARSLALMLFGACAKLLFSRQLVLQALLDALESNDPVELYAAVGALERFLSISSVACIGHADAALASAPERGPEPSAAAAASDATGSARHATGAAADTDTDWSAVHRGVLHSLALFVQRVRSPMHLKLQIVPLFRFFSSDRQLSSMALTTLRKLMDDYPLADFLVAGIDTCNELVLASGVGGEELVELLVERVRSDPRPALKCAAIRALKRLIPEDAEAANSVSASELSDFNLAPTSTSTCAYGDGESRGQLCGRLSPLVSYVEHLHDMYSTSRRTRARDLSALPALVAHLLRVLDAALPALDEHSAAALLHLCATRFLALRPDAERTAGGGGGGGAETAATALRPMEQLGLFHLRAASLRLLARCFLPPFLKLRSSLPPGLDVELLSSEVSRAVLDLTQWTAIHMAQLERVAQRAETAAIGALEKLFECVSRIARSRAHSPSETHSRWLQSTQASVLTAFAHLWSAASDSSCSSESASLVRQLSAALGAFLSLLVRSSRVLAAPAAVRGSLLLALTASLRSAAQIARPAATTASGAVPLSLCTLWPLLRPAMQLAADLMGPYALDSESTQRQRAPGARVASALFDALELLIQRTRPSAWHLFCIVRMACLEGCYSLAARVLTAHFDLPSSSCNSSTAARAVDCCLAFASPGLSSHLRDWLRALSLVARAESRLAECAGDGETDATATATAATGSLTGCVDDSDAGGAGVRVLRATADARALYEEAHALLLCAAHSMPAGALDAAQTRLQLRVTQLAAARLALLEQVAQLLAKYAPLVRPPPPPPATSVSALQQTQTPLPAPRGIYSAGDRVRLSRLAAGALQIGEQYNVLLLECVDADAQTIDLLQRERVIAVFEHWLLLCISSSASHFQSHSQSRSHADEQTSARHLVSLRALARALSDNADPLSSFARSLLSHLEPAAATLSPKAAHVQWCLWRAAAELLRRSPALPPMFFRTVRRTSVELVLSPAPRISSWSESAPFLVRESVFELTVEGRIHSRATAAARPTRARASRIAAPASAFAFRDSLLELRAKLAEPSSSSSSTAAAVAVAVSESRAEALRTREAAVQSKKSYTRARRTCRSGYGSDAAPVPLERVELIVRTDDTHAFEARRVLDVGASEYLRCSVLLPLHRPAPGAPIRVQLRAAVLTRPLPLPLGVAAALPSPSSSANAEQTSGEEDEFVRWPLPEALAYTQLQYIPDNTGDDPMRAVSGMAVINSLA